MQAPPRIRSAAIVTIAMILAGCSPAPSVTPTPPASARPTPTPSSTASTSHPERLAGVHLGELDRPRSTSLTYGPVSATPHGFVIAGSDGPASPLIWQGDATGASWTLGDAARMGREIVDLAVGSVGWIAATTMENGEFSLWTSQDGSLWLRYREPPGVNAAVSVHVDASDRAFSVDAEASPGRTILYTSTDGANWTAGSEYVAPGGGPVARVGESYIAALDIIASGGPVMFSTSTDGRSWQPVPSVGAVPTQVDELFDAGGGVVAFGWTNRRGHGRAWYGTVSEAESGPVISWTETTPVDRFGRKGVAAQALSDSFGIRLSHDPSTHAPIAWTTSGPDVWLRPELPISTFGHGVPTNVAVVGTTAVALGWRVNDAGQWVRQPWRSVDGGPWSAVDARLFGRLPKVPTGPCPPTGLHESASYLAWPALLRPVCFGDRTLRIRGYAVDCGGCGGSDQFERHPAWLQHALGIWDLYLQATPRALGRFPERLGISIDPAHPIKIPRVGAYVEIVGHFDDPAAATCTEEPGIPGGGLDPPSILVATCRQEFVARGITVLAN